MHSNKHVVFELLDSSKIAIVSGGWTQCECWCANFVDRPASDGGVYVGNPCNWSDNYLVACADKCLRQLKYKQYWAYLG